MAPDVLILCGGLGTRLSPLVSDRPKSMAEVNGKPFLELLIRSVKEYGFGRLILCVGYLADMIEGYFGTGRKWDLEIVFSREARPLGTAGAIKNAEDQISSDPFLVLNGDSFAKADLQELLAFHRRHEADISLLLVPVRDSQRFGSVKIGADSQITHFLEKRRESAPGLINAGIYVISRKILPLISPGQFSSLEHDVFPRKIHELRIFGMPVAGDFIDIGVPESYQHLLDNYRDYFEDTLFDS